MLSQALHCLNLNSYLIFTTSYDIPFKDHCIVDGDLGLRDVGTLHKVTWLVTA